MRNQLRNAVVALAQPASVQLELFPNFVCTADELALNLEDGLYEIVGHEDEFSSEQRAAIAALDQILSDISGQRHAAFWTDLALREHPTWADIRVMAAETAALFGWDIATPHASGAIYIPGGPGRR